MQVALANPLVVYTVTLFVSALLLFLVQPMVGKIILPKFGGTPAVWNTCMVFFQAALLAGYAYAHGSTTRLPIRRQVKIHLGLLVLPLAMFVFFPLGYSDGFDPPGDQYPMIWVLLLLALIIGLPFFVVSTSAPLLQRWFGHTGHSAARDPYFLYAASNFGSMSSLLLFPTIFAPNLEVPHQGLFWMIGYVLLAVLTAWCAILVLKAAPVETVQEREVRETEAEIAREEEAEKEVETDASKAEENEEQAQLPAEEQAQLPAEAPSEAIEEAKAEEPGVAVKTSKKKKRAKDRARDAVTKDVIPVLTKAHERFTPPPVQPFFAEPQAPSLMTYLRWILLAFVPSSLMLGVTTYMTTDISAIPLLWIIPLTLYLISFILVFSKTTSVVHPIMVLMLPVAVLLMVFQGISDYDIALKWEFLLHLAVLFIVAMVCHGELARRRPATRYLTGFYLCMSTGGVLGGLFNAVVAPLVFISIAEYSIILVVACLLMPTPAVGEQRSRLNQYVDIGLAVALGGFAGWVIFLYLCQWFGDGYVNLFSQHLPSLAEIPSFKSPFLGIAVVLCIIASLLAYVTFARRTETVERILDIALPVALCLLTVWIIWAHPFRNWNEEWFKDKLGVSLDSNLIPKIHMFLQFGIPVALCYGFAERPIRFGLGVGALLLASTLHHIENNRGTLLFQDRSFFGVLKVEEEWDYVPGDRYIVFHKLLHGTTLHGMQVIVDDKCISAVPSLLASRDPFASAARLLQVKEYIRDRQNVALTYYHRTGPIGQVYEALVNKENVAFVGLGTGTMASYANPGQTVTFYEIDPEMVKLAKDPKYFTYLRDCRGKYQFNMGDARLQLAQDDVPDHHYKLIVVDAFSSDSIPVHLITRQAIQLYLRKLQKGGVVALHISNRYLNLQPVLSRIAAEEGISGLQQYDGSEDHLGKSASDWVILAKDPENFGSLREDVERWPGDHDRRWKNFSRKGDASRLSDDDLKDWREQILYVYESSLKRNLPAEFPTYDKEKLDKVVSEELEKKRKDLESKPREVTIDLIQQGMDEEWKDELNWHERVGLWTDHYSNILAIFDKEGSLGFSDYYEGVIFQKP